MLGGNNWGWGVWRWPNGNAAWWSERVDRKVQLRRRWRYQRRVTDRLREHELPGEAPTPEEQLELTELRAVVAAVLAELPPRERLVLLLRYGFAREGEGLTCREVGAALGGISYERARQLEYKALRRLQYEPRAARLRPFSPEAEDEHRRRRERLVAAKLLTSEVRVEARFQAVAPAAAGV